MAYCKMTPALVLLCGLLSVVCAQQAGYLPPQKGYSYEPPRIPFPNTNQESKVPFPTQRPKIPTTGPTYRPPQGTDHHHEHHEHHDNHDHHDHHHHEPGMPFDFTYAVKEPEYGNDYSHNAVSDGDITRGEYRVALPDGRLQIVRYTADWKNGFNAEVSYEGEAKFPDQPQGQASGINSGYGSPPSGGYKY